MRVLKICKPCIFNFNLTLIGQKHMFHVRYNFQIYLLAEMFVWQFNDVLIHVNLILKQLDTHAVLKKSVLLLISYN